MYLKILEIGGYFSNRQFVILRFVRRSVPLHLTIKELFEPNGKSEQMFNAF